MQVSDNKRLDNESSDARFISAGTLGRPPWDQRGGREGRGGRGGGRKKKGGNVILDRFFEYKEK